MDADVLWGGWNIGSKLWLLERAKILSTEAPQGATTTLVKNYIYMALEPFVQRRVCSSFDVWVTRVDDQRIDALIRIYRGPLPGIDLRYQVLWQELTGIQDSTTF